MLHMSKQAEVITPPNDLKGKVGSGSLSYDTIQKAQHLMDISDVDIIPESKILLIHVRKGIDTARQDLKAGCGFTKRARRDITYPLMQLKSNGAMFHYPLITDVASRILSFVSHLTQINEDALKIIEAYYNTLQIIVKKRVKEDREGFIKPFLNELDYAQTRYQKRYEIIYKNDNS